LQTTKGRRKIIFFLFPTITKIGVSKMLPSVSDLKLAAIKNKWDESTVDRIIRQIEKDVDLARKLGAANLLTNMKF